MLMLPSSPFAVSEFSQKIFPAQRGLLSEQKLAHSTQYKMETIIANHRATMTIIPHPFFPLRLLITKAPYGQNMATIWIVETRGEKIAPSPLPSQR